MRVVELPRGRRGARLGPGMRAACTSWLNGVAGAGDGGCSALARVALYNMCDTIARGPRGGTRGASRAAFCISTMHPAAMAAAEGPGSRGAAPRPRHLPTLAARKQAAQRSGAASGSGHCSNSAAALAPTRAGAYSPSTRAEPPAMPGSRLIACFCRLGSALPAGARAFADIVACVAAVVGAQAASSAVASSSTGRIAGS